MIRRMATDKTIILSTHILQEVDAMAGHIIVIHKGKIVSDTPADALRSEHRTLEQAFRALTLEEEVVGA